MELCNKYDIQLLEDSAHGYGCSFDGKMCGSFGVVSTISSQANKLVNTEDVALKYKYTCSNKSVRMTNLQAALMCPQLQVMEERIQQHNSMYQHLVDSHHVFDLLFKDHTNAAQ